MYGNRYQRRRTDCGNVVLSSSMLVEPNAMYLWYLSSAWSQVLLPCGTVVSIPSTGTKTFFHIVLVPWPVQWMQASRMLLWLKQSLNNPPDKSRINYLSKCIYKTHEFESPFMLYAKPSFLRKSSALCLWSHLYMKWKACLISCIPLLTTWRCTLTISQLKRRSRIDSFFHFDSQWEFLTIRHVCDASHGASCYRQVTRQWCNKISFWQSMSCMLATVKQHVIRKPFCNSIILQVRICYMLPFHSMDVYSDLLWPRTLHFVACSSLFPTL